MEFELGQIFSGKYPPEAALWCGRNNCTIVRDGTTGWRIEAIPPPTEDEQKAAKMAEVRTALADMDWRSMREHDRLASLPDYKPDNGIFAYKEYLRDFDKQDGRWWEMGILGYEDYWTQRIEAADLGEVSENESS
ncbi:MAG: hypothetical protein LBP65_01940 [Puniceicoccales bacterium]|jgi:hypothetical protein|nr:hypothetical protein [Puniceicoccales bacterium]